MTTEIVVNVPAKVELSDDDIIKLLEQRFTVELKTYHIMDGDIYKLERVDWEDYDYVKVTIIGTEKENRIRTAHALMGTLKSLLF